MLEDKWKRLIKDTIQKYLGDKVEVFIFGSRATGKNRKWSDVDVGIISKEKIQGAEKIEIEHEISESDIPYLVDIVDFKNVSSDFAKFALSTTIKL